MKLGRARVVRYQVTSYCTVADCEMPAAARGLCWKHLKRLQRTGNATLTTTERGMRFDSAWARLREAFFALYDVSAEDDAAHWRADKRAHMAALSWVRSRLRPRR